MKNCLNPDCSVVCFAMPNEEDSNETCPNCGLWTCERCGSFFDPDAHLTDCCIYCNGKGRIDCDDKDRSLDFCSGCGMPCPRRDDLEDESEND